MPRRLGRGLDTLLSARGSGSTAPDDSGAHSQSEIDVARILPNPHQPRQVFDEVELDQLRKSIESHGVLQPIVVRPKGDGYQLIAGERRWRAAQLAGRTTVPAVVLEVEDEQMLELAIVENVQRSDLDAIEKAEAFHALETELGLSQDQVAAKVGLQRSTVANFVRLLELPEAVQIAVRKGLISMGHARALLALPEDPERVRMMELVVRGRLSVRELETQIRKHLDRKPKKRPRPAASQPPWAREIEGRLREKLGARVHVQVRSPDRGQIVLEYGTRGELDRMLEILAPRPTL